jgi:hypothetical protein
VRHQPGAAAAPQLGQVVAVILVSSSRVKPPAAAQKSRRQVFSAQYCPLARRENGPGKIRPAIKPAILAPIFGIFNWPVFSHLRALFLPAKSKAHCGAGDFWTFFPRKYGGIGFLVRDASPNWIHK